MTLDEAVEYALTSAEENGARGGRRVDQVRRLEAFGEPVGDAA